MKQTTHEEMSSYEQLSPFELKDKLIHLAEGKLKKSARMLLNAGRGNPNWTAAAPREAFFLLGQFSVVETKRTWSVGTLAGVPQLEGISDRLFSYLDEHKNMPGADLLRQMIHYGIEVCKFNKDKWVFELVDGIIGDDYPVPERMLVHTEKVVHNYLIQEMCGGNDEHNYDIFAVEGGTAAICYIFDSLIANHLLSIGDKIAIMVPVFTPYLEIPHLSRYQFDVEYIHASEMDENDEHTRQYPNEEIDKLRDSSIKALFVVNPSNPSSVSLRPSSVNYLMQAVKEDNPDLMVITDDVYGTFVDDFHSLMEMMPYNTICVYSYSKYFGATGWRLGVIALSEHNVYDKLIKELSLEHKAELEERYSSLTCATNCKFIDRMVADSRQVALNHTAGLSTPQQIQMALFSIFAMIDQEDTYKSLTKEICHRRKKLLYEGLCIPFKYDPYDTAYYSEIDLLVWAKNEYGQEFAEYLTKNYHSMDLLFTLAKEHSIILLSGYGFLGPKWSIRVSLANLRDASYSEIGTAIRAYFTNKVQEWQSSK